ncbi:zinc finger CCHC domain-containing protein 7 isoform X1 [Pseudophryne corroboree]|uniref:zinc finger CCHC domain-containing protein 7 isoform X1 n=1 Tax=Pseudophryne corroboree TaxID=495146 RepID=UPI003081A2CF
MLNPREPPGSYTVPTTCSRILLCLLPAATSCGCPSADAHVEPALSADRTYLTMFNDERDVIAYEDELYREESSSDESIDSEVECYLYSQVHYSQNLNEADIEELEENGQGVEVGVSERIQNLNYNNSRQKDSVIAIPDSDDIKASDSSAVIILSDSLDEDSVYYSKIKGKLLRTEEQPGNQSTPKASTAKKKVSRVQRSKSLNSSKSYKGGVVQEVVVIRGSSEEEDVHVGEEELSTSDSEQSGVESWMLLGRAREDGDTSIQLNLEGCRRFSSEGDGGIQWSVSEKDSEAQIANYSPFRRVNNRYYTGDKNVVCRNCNRQGHLSKNCPVPKKLPACCLCGKRGHLQYSCPAPYCSNCFLPGHGYKDCTDRPHWQKNCHRCSMTGHYADACPEIWRQYHLTVVPGPAKRSMSASSPKDVIYCCNCGRRGHCGYECNERRMYSSVFPSCELVFTYDEKHDIWSRKHRAKRKIKELQEAGLLPSQISVSKVDISQIPKRHWKKPRRDIKWRHKEVNQELYTLRQLKHQKKSSKAVHSQEREEYFPRGKSDKSGGARRPHAKKKSQHFLFKDGRKKVEVDGQLKKNKKKHRKRKNTTVDESLLRIKQRKKKSKKGVD